MTFPADSQMRAPLSMSEAQPQRFTVRHLSTYRYAEPVTFGEHRMMFWPRSSHDLRLIATDIRITPVPTRLHWLHDVFDNSVAVANFSAPSDELRFESHATLEHFEAPLPDYALEDRAAAYPFAYTEEEAPNLVHARSRPMPSDAVDQWAWRFVDPYGPTHTMRLLRDMTFEIKEGFQYRRRIEKGVQSPEETLSYRSGSCRDFAVLMMDAARSLGLAARFVSGYIFVPDQGGAQGGGATHAWLQIYLPGAGWVDFDPTNSIIGNRHLIRVAVAWNCQQALPLWGTWYGVPQAFLGLDVDVAVTEVDFDTHSRKWVL